MVAGVLVVTMAHASKVLVELDGRERVGGVEGANELGSSLPAGAQGRWVRQGECTRVMRPTPTLLGEGSEAIALLPYVPVLARDRRRVPDACARLEREWLAARADRVRDRG